MLSLSQNSEIWLFSRHTSELEYLKTLSIWRQTSGPLSNPSVPSLALFIGNGFNDWLAWWPSMMQAPLTWQHCQYDLQGIQEARASRCRWARAYQTRLVAACLSSKVRADNCWNFVSEISKRSPGALACCDLGLVTKYLAKMKASGVCHVESIKTTYRINT